MGNIKTKPLEQKNSIPTPPLPVNLFQQDKPDTFLEDQQSDENYYRCQQLNNKIQILNKEQEQEKLKLCQKILKFFHNIYEKMINWAKFNKNEKDSDKTSQKEQKQIEQSNLLKEKEYQQILEKQKYKIKPSTPQLPYLQTEPMLSGGIFSRSNELNSSETKINEQNRYSGFTQNKLIPFNFSITDQENNKEVKELLLKDKENSDHQQLQQKQQQIQLKNNWIIQQDSNEEFYSKEDEKQNEKKQTYQRNIYLPQTAKNHFITNDTPQRIEEFLNESNKDSPSIIRQTLQSYKLQTQNESDDTNLSQEILLQKGNFVGQGPHGSVYAGLNLNSGEILAIKTITSIEETIPSDDIQFFEDQVIKIKHENIMSMIGITFSSTVEDAIDIISEFVSGGSILDIVKSIGSLDEKLIANFMKQILNGLNFLHSKNILHRNLKSSNILLESEGVIKICDIFLTPLKFSETELDNNPQDDGDDEARDYSKIYYWVFLVIYIDYNFQGCARNFSKFQRKSSFKSQYAKIFEISRYMKFRMYCILYGNRVSSIFEMEQKRIRNC